MEIKEISPRSQKTKVWCGWGIKDEYLREVSSFHKFMNMALSNPRNVDLSVALAKALTE